MKRRKLIKTSVFMGAGLTINVLAGYLSNSSNQSQDLNIDRQKNSQLNTFNFEIVEVNEIGEIIESTQGKAKFFKENLGNGIALEMVYIRAGQFLMGAPASERGSRDGERPQNEVTLKPFYLGRFTVTQSQWRVVAALPKVDLDLNANPSHFKGDNLPVESISWYDAIEFCQRLSHHTGKTYRLPSEAEWEYAARAGTTTPFHFGANINTDLVNYCGINRKMRHGLLLRGTYGKGKKGIFRAETTPVGYFKVANAFGLSDIHGNVRQWCQDDYSYFSYGKNFPDDGKPWFSSDKFPLKVARGGDWFNGPRSCRSANRLTRKLDRPSRLIGFRVVAE